MTEPKIKLQLNRKISLTDKPPASQTKLLINHGKPNFIIDRGNNNYKKFHLDEIDSALSASANQKNDFAKVILKSVPNNGETNDAAQNKSNGQIDKKIENEFMQKHRKISEKKIARETQGEQQPQSNPNEFLEKFRQISDKSNTDLKQDNSNSIVIHKQNNSVKNLILLKENNAGQLKKPQFGHMTNNRIVQQNDTVVLRNDNIDDNMAKQNGNDKPKIAEKPIHLRTSNPSPAPSAEALDDDQIVLIENEPETLSGIGQLKFDIETSNGDIVVTPVIR